MNKFFWIKSCVLMIVLSVGLMCRTYGQEDRFSWDFSECEISDIVFAISMDSGISIVVDDTVRGKGNFKFSGNDFDSAFDCFLNASRLFVSKTDEVWTVSRIQITKENELICVDAYDLTPGEIFEKISLFLGTVITYDQLPGMGITVHLKNLDEERIIENLCRRLGGYSVSKNERGYHLEKQNVVLNKKIDSRSGYEKVELMEDGSVVVETNDARISDVLEKIFKVGNAEFCFIGACDGKIGRCSFTGKDFKDALDKFCILCGFGIVINDGIFYVVQDNSKKEKLISDTKKWYRWNLNYVKAEKVVQLLGRRFLKFEAMVLPDEMSFLYYADSDEKIEIDRFIGMVDVKKETRFIELKYLNSDEFIKCLPPSVDKKALYAGENKSGIYFTGNENDYKTICEELKNWDKPLQRISYDLLILQYDEGSEFNWTSGISGHVMKFGDRHAGILKLGSVLNLNLDIVSSFGITFASNLQTSIENNTTRVYADTTLHGISGKKINFQNTNTYRYRDNNLDPETGKPVYSGITKEIVSGLKLDIVGNVRGDGAITSCVTASISRQGVDSSDSTGNPPPTTEKLITTEVCGRSGEPVILSGLIQNSVSSRASESPIFSKIPVLGYLMKNTEKISEKSQMVIYLIPHVESVEQQLPVLFDSEWGEKKCHEILKQLKIGGLNGKL